MSRVRSEGGDYGTLLRELGVDREIDACNNGDNMPIQEVTGESDFGGALDVVTDNIVHAGVFVGLLIGCYRVDHSHAYLYLIPILLGGFAMCAFATWRAFKVKGDQAAAWLEQAQPRWREMP